MPPSSLMLGKYFFLQSIWIKCLILNIYSPNDLNFIIHVESFPEQPPFELSLTLHSIKHFQRLIVLMALCWLWLFPPLLVGILSIHRLVCQGNHHPLHVDNNNNCLNKLVFFLMLGGLIHSGRLITMAVSVSWWIDSPSLPYPGLWRGLLPECSKSSHGISSDVQLKEETSTFKKKDFFYMCQLTQSLTSMVS